MTDNEIIKAFRLCHRQNGVIPCFECPYYSVDADECLGDNNTDILDLINRQKAEIERLSDRNHKCIYLSDEESIEYCVDGPCPNFKIESQIKTEAVKEFAERLKEQMCQENELYKSCAKGLLPKDYQQGYEEKNDNVIRLIDNLVKEMVGEG